MGRGKNLRALSGSQVIKYPCWGGVRAQHLQTSLCITPHIPAFENLSMHFLFLCTVLPHFASPLPSSSHLTFALFTTSRKSHWQGYKNFHRKMFKSVWKPKYLPEILLNTFFLKSHLLLSSPSLLTDSQKMTLHLLNLTPHLKHTGHFLWLAHRNVPSPDLPFESINSYYTPSLACMETPLHY